MKKLFTFALLAMALMLPFAAMAQSESKTTIKVGNDADSPNIGWTITAEEEGDNNFVITFDGAIKEG